MAACATLRTLATLVIVCGVHVSRVAVARDEGPVWWGWYTSANGKKVDGEGARILCTMKKILDGVADRATFLEETAVKYLNRAQVVFGTVLHSGNIKEMVGEKSVEEFLDAEKLAATVGKYVEAAYVRAKGAALNSSRFLSDRLKWHCLDGGRRPVSPYNYTTNNNCEEEAFARERFHYYHVNDRRKNSILCDYKVISSNDTVASFELMETALRNWNRVKPKPNLTKLTWCNVGQGPRGEGGKPLPCIFSEAWLQDYNASKYSMARLHKLAHVAVRIAKYAETLARDGRVPTDAVRGGKEVPEVSKRQAAEAAAKEAKIHFENDENKWRMAKMDMDTKKLAADKVREAEREYKEIGERIETLKKELKEAEANRKKLEESARLAAENNSKTLKEEKDAEVRLKAAETKAEISKKMLEETEAERVRVEGVEEVAQWEAEDVVQSPTDLKKEVYRSHERVSEYDEGDGIADDQGKKRKLILLLVRFILFLLFSGLLLFFILRGRKEMNNYNNVSENGFRKELEMSGVSTLDVR